VSSKVPRMAMVVRAGEFLSELLVMFFLELRCYVYPCLNYSWCQVGQPIDDHSPLLKADLR
jgi:hypothetical protein